MSMSSYVGDAGKQQLACDLRSVIRATPAWAQADERGRRAADMIIDASVHDRDCWPPPDHVCQRLSAVMLQFFVARART